MPNITTNHAITYTKLDLSCSSCNFTEKKIWLQPMLPNAYPFFTDVTVPEIFAKVNSEQFSLRF